MIFPRAEMQGSMRVGTAHEGMKVIQLIRKVSLSMALRSTAKTHLLTLLPEVLARAV